MHALHRAIAVTLVAGAACGPPTPGDRAPILLLAGAGTSRDDIAAVEQILDDNQLVYTTATSRQLNRMSRSQLMGYRLMIVPGGNFIDMSTSISPQAAVLVHEAVQGGVNYLGICAGAFLAGDGRGYYKSFDLASGARFGFYTAENRGIRKAAVALTAVDGRTVEQYWEDGPDLTGWGAVVATYPDGTAAVVEGTSGKGWVILAGVHPEAPDTWRRGMAFTTPASVTHAYAAMLVKAALTRSPLPHF